MFGQTGAQMKEKRSSLPEEQEFLREPMLFSKESCRLPMKITRDPLVSANWQTASTFLS
jgi:hypothetical protein